MAITHYGTVTLMFEADSEDKVEETTERIKELVESDPEIAVRCNITEDSWSDDATT